jgi:hypothetical protein
VYLRYLSEALQELGHRVTVISGPPYPNLVLGVKLVKLPSLDLYSRDLWSVSREELVNRLGGVEWVSKLTGGFAEPWTFGERARNWVLANAGLFDVVHDNQTLAPGVLDLQRAGLPVVTTIHHPITRDLRMALSEERVWWRRLLIRRCSGRVTNCGCCQSLSDWFGSEAVPGNSPHILCFPVSIQRCLSEKNLSLLLPQLEDSY